MTDIIYCDKYIIKIVPGKESDVSTTICYYCFFFNTCTVVRTPYNMHAPRHFPGNAGTKYLKDP